MKPVSAKYSLRLLLSVTAIIAILLSLSLFRAKARRDLFRTISDRGAIVLYENDPPASLKKIADIYWGPWFDSATHVSFYANVEGDMIRIGDDLLTIDEAELRLEADRDIVENNSQATFAFYVAVDESLKYSEDLVNDLLNFGVAEFGEAGGTSWPMYKEEWLAVKSETR